MVDLETIHRTLITRWEYADLSLKFQLKTHGTPTLKLKTRTRKGPSVITVLEDHIKLLCKNNGTIYKPLGSLKTATMNY